MSQSHALLRAARLLHLYLGIFTAPALLFFAFTGALQTFNLHEAGQGSSYKPPAWIASLAQLHKHQTMEAPAHRPKGPGQPGGPGHDDDHGEHHEHHEEGAPSSPGGGASAPAQKQTPHLPMKIFFLVVSVGLFLSTVTGIYMSYRYSRNRLVVALLLVAGVVLPLVLLPF